MVDIFCEKWGNGQAWENKFVGGPHEANFLKLDCSKLKKVFGWKPTWNVEKAIEKTCEWAKSYMFKQDINMVMNNQINEFISEEEP